MKSKAITTVMLILFLASILSMGSVMAATLVPIVDDPQVLPTSAVSGMPTTAGGTGAWDMAQQGLVVERGPGYVDVGMPDGRVSPNYWGIHCKITFNDAQVTDVKSWMNDGTTLVSIDANPDNIPWYGVEYGDDGLATLGDPWQDEVDWLGDIAHVNPPSAGEVEFWLTTSSGRDCFRIWLNYESAYAAMCIDFIGSYGSVDSLYYGVGDTEGWTIDMQEYCTLLPLIDMVEVDIDIKPGSDPNSINMGSRGTIPVAILSTPDFDATDVNPETVTLAGAAVGVRGKGNKLLASIEDVNGDGLLDLVVHIENDLDLAEGATEATLTGLTMGGILIEGTDTVRVVPP